MYSAVLHFPSKTDAPLVDNTGAAIAPVDDATITGSMNYFVKGVELA